MTEVQKDIFSNDPQTLAAMIRLEVEKGHVNYQDPLCGFLIIQCLWKIREPGEPNDESEWTSFLRTEFPEMDERTRKDYIFVTQRTTPENRYSLPAFGPDGLKKVMGFFKELDDENPDSNGDITVYLATRPVNGSRVNGSRNKSKRWRKAKRRRKR